MQLSRVNYGALVARVLRVLKGHLIKKRWRLLLSLVVLEAANYMRYASWYRWFNAMRCNRHTRAQIKTAVDSLMAQNPTTIERMKLHPAMVHLTNADALVDALHVGEFDSAEQPCGVMCTGKSRLHWFYRPLVLDCVHALAFGVGWVRLRQMGFEQTEYPTCVGKYHVWSRHVAGTKPVVFFPGFGVGAAPYARALLVLNRTIHAVVGPNMTSAWTWHSGQYTSDTLYDTVRRHLTGEEHDVLGHSMGSQMAASYANAQYVRGTEQENQTFVVVDGYSSPVDSFMACNGAFVVYDHWGKMGPILTKSHSLFVFYVTWLFSNLQFTATTKRFHSIVECTFWRDDYKARMVYCHSKADDLFDVPFMLQSGKVTLLSKGGHGDAFFGADWVQNGRKMRALLDRDSDV